MFEYQTLWYPEWPQDPKQFSSRDAPLNPAVPNKLCSTKHPNYDMHFPLKINATCSVQSVINTAHTVTHSATSCLQDARTHAQRCRRTESLKPIKTPHAQLRAVSSSTKGAVGTLARPSLQYLRPYNAPRCNWVLRKETIFSPSLPPCRPLSHRRCALSWVNQATSSGLGSKFDPQLENST
jgi:hypothetical protein